MLKRTRSCFRRPTVRYWWVKDLSAYCSAYVCIDLTYVTCVWRVLFVFICQRIGWRKTSASKQACHVLNRTTTRATRVSSKLDCSVVVFGQQREINAIFQSNISHDRSLLKSVWTTIIPYIHFVNASVTSQPTSTSFPFFHP